MVDVTTYLGQSVESTPALNFLSTKLPGTGAKNDLEAVGIGGFTLYVTIKNARTLTSTAPDISLEDGSEITDTIFLKPVMLTIEGDVADIHMESFDADDSVFKPVTKVVGLTNTYAPLRTQGQIDKLEGLFNDATNALNKLDALLEDGNKLLGVFGDKSDVKSIQEQFIDAIDQLHFSKSLVSLEAPFRVYNNMRILSFATNKDNTSNKIKFTITAKQLRFAKVAFTEIKGAPKPSEGLGGATEGTTDKGPTVGVETPTSLASSLLSAIKGG